MHDATLLKQKSLNATTLHDDETQSARINSTRSMHSRPSRGVLTYINGMPRLTRIFRKMSIEILIRLS